MAEAEDEPEHDPGEEDAHDAPAEKWWRLSNETVIAIGGLITAIGTVIGASHGSGGPT